MKKCVFIIAYSLLSIARAASVNWTTGDFATDGFSDHSGAKLTLEMGYEISLVFYSDAAGTEKVMECSSSSIFALFGSISGTAAGDASEPPSYFKGNTTYYVQALLTNKEWERITGISAFSVPETGNASLNISSGSGFATEGNKWGEWKSVPEPTSGILLLLGFAGIALRRKQKKTQF